MRILEPNFQLPIVARTHGWLTLMSVSALLAACGGGQSGSADPAAAAQQKSAALPIASIVQTTMPCEGLLTVAVESAQVTAAAFVPSASITGPDGTTSTAPPYCKVRAVATPVPGSVIDIEVRLPTAENWNGRFQGLGNGGYAGTGTVDLAMNGAGTTAVAAGFAVATTDMGTTPSNILNADVLIGQPQKWIDWGSRATHLMTTVSKSLVTAFYGRGPQWSYFNGCSTGGQQGMMSAQRYPDDYDGILAGAPAANRTHLHTNFVTNYNALNATPNSRFTPASARLLTDAVVKVCAAKTGGIEGDAFLTDPRGCDFDPGVLQCTPSSTTDCLHADQVEAARKIYRGTRTASSDALIFPGLAMGSEASAFVTQGLLHEPLFASLFKWVFGPTWTSAGYDFDSNTDVVDSVLAGILNANNPSLDAFKSRGGKLLRYHGWADDAIPPQDSINAYKSTIAHESQKSPGRALQRTQDYYRLFMVPGLLHCEGGPGPSAFGQKDVGVAQPLSADSSGNAMIALQQWVEGGIAPQRLVATNPGNGMARPLCPYPKSARYNGTGPTNDASSFTCETSPYDAPAYNPAPAEKYMR
jgi:feruloyl esterase